MLLIAMCVFTAIGVTAAVIQDIQFGAHDPIDPNLYDPPIEFIDPVQVEPVLIEPGVVTGAQWFEAQRPYCNPVDVVTRMRWHPAPESNDGLMFEAACYALAGRLDEARAAINRLPDAQQYEAAGVVFNAGHPAADAGDELAAGPLMELVVEYWPNHYMALYHAGSAASQRGDAVLAVDYMTRFLQHYSAEDGWRRNALEVIESHRGR
jgi:tetratricopeptide (TPR) repeat protein